LGDFLVVTKPTPICISESRKRKAFIESVALRGLDACGVFLRTEGAKQDSPGQASAARAALGQSATERMLHAESVRQACRVEVELAWPESCLLCPFGAKDNNQASGELL